MRMESLYTLATEAGLRRLVERFYDLMDTLPEVQEIRQMHAPDLASARDKLFWFLVGYSGGPPLYVERFGHPRLRARHLPFAIGDSARDQWMLCMTRALEDTFEDTDIRLRFGMAFKRMADHMRNQ